MTPKFRVWLKKEGNMAAIGDMHFKDGELYFIRLEQNGPITYGTSWNHVPKHKSEDVVLMQSTGFFDCNGEEIYEGDVLFIGERHRGDKSYKGEVVFWQLGERGNSIYTTTEKMVVNSSPHNLVMLEEADRLQILGNIYENPELLEEVEK